MQTDRRYSEKVSQTDMRGNMPSNFGLFSCVARDGHDLVDACIADKHRIRGFERYSLDYDDYPEEEEEEELSDDMVLQLVESSLMALHSAPPEERNRIISLVHSLEERLLHEAIAFEDLPAMCAVYTEAGSDLPWSNAHEHLLSATLRHYASFAQHERLIILKFWLHNSIDSLKRECIRESVVFRPEFQTLIKSNLGFAEARLLKLIYVQPYLANIQVLGHTTRTRMRACWCDLLETMHDETVANEDDYIESMLFNYWEEDSDALPSSELPGDSSLYPNSELLTESD